MARELIVDLEATFSDGEYYGDLFGLAVGEKYTVVWGDEEFPDLTAVQASLLGRDAIIIGNLDIFDGADTGEPFLIGDTVGTGAILSYDATITTKRVAIYKGVAEKVGIVLKDRDGNPETHYPTGGIRLPMSDGSTSLFVNADDLPKAVSVTVDPDFTGNKNMTVVPENGTQFSEVIVKKPENLISEYIKDGINIAGITGEFQGSGGNVKVAWGILPKPTSDSTNHTFTHNLGVLPNVILIDTISRPSSPAISYAHNIVAYSNAFGAVLGTTNYQRLLKGYSTSGSQLSRSYQASNFGITWPAANTAGIVCMANETSFTVVGLDAESAYFWVAIGGLT